MSNIKKHYLRASACTEAFLTMLSPAMRLPAVQIDIAGAARRFRELQAGTAATFI